MRRHRQTARQSLPIAMKHVSVAVFCSLLLAAFASPLEERADLGLVPGVGYIPRANIHEVPEGAKIERDGDDVKLVGADGKLLHRAKFGFTRNATAARQPLSKRAENGWNVAGSFFKDTSGASPQINSLFAQWVVSLSR